MPNVRHVIRYFSSLLLCLSVANNLLADEASLSDLAKQNQQQCLTSAANYFSLSTDILLAIRDVEGAWTGARLTNKNKSVDHGIMGINSVWEKALNKRGITLQQVAENDCLSIWVGAWILANYLYEADAYTDDPSPSKYWRGIGYYNSHTTALNEKYALKVWQKMIARQQQAETKENN